MYSQLSLVISILCVHNTLDILMKSLTRYQRNLKNLTGTDFTVELNIGPSEKGTSSLQRTLSIVQTSTGNTLSTSVKRTASLLGVVPNCPLLKGSNVQCISL